YTMLQKTLLIILGASVGGTIAIAVGMLSASGWETPGIYTGISDASHVPASTTNCFSFQTGCKNTNSSIPASAMDSGAYLSGNYNP
ncbi:MAG: hypothetical protein KGH85_08525, partial [Thaumarchaeota archaeon]|nr:hypothetical protein [Nitrososphaerota archaeon]